MLLPKLKNLIFQYIVQFSKIWNDEPFLNYEQNNIQTSTGLLQSLNHYSNPCQPFDRSELKILLREQVGGVLSRKLRPLRASSPSRSTSCQRPLPLSSRRSRRRRSLTLCTPRTLGIQETAESSKSLPRSLIPTATHTSTKTSHLETQTQILKEFRTMKHEWHCLIISGIWRSKC